VTEDGTLVRNCWTFISFQTELRMVTREEGVFPRCVEIEGTRSAADGCTPWVAVTA
jgi:hypothetical protein